MGKGVKGMEELLSEFYYGGYPPTCLQFPFDVLILLPAMSACNYLALTAQVLHGAVGKKEQIRNLKNKTLIYLSIQDLSGKTEANYLYFLVSLDKASIFHLGNFCC